MITSLMVRTDLTVSLLPVAQQFKDEALELAALIGTVKSAATQESAVEALSKIKGVLKLVEESRKEIKAPVLALAADIDSTARNFIVALKSEELRISTLVGNFQQEQLAIARRQEEARQAEIRRIEDERLAGERKAREQAEANERERQRKEAELKKAEEAALAAAQAPAPVQSGGDDQRETMTPMPSPRFERTLTLEQIQQERRLIAQDRQIESKAVEKQIERGQQLTEQAVMALGPEVVSVRAEGQKVKDTFDFEVTDIQLLQRMHPGFVKMEPRRDEIMLAIEKGCRDIKGLRIKPVIKIQVKAERMKVIDV